MYELSLRGTKLSFTVGAVGALAFLLQGYDQAVVNGLLTLNTWEKQFPEINTTANKSSHTSLLQGTAVALYEVGCAFGAVSCFFLGDRLGRRRVIFGAACTVVVGVILQTTAFSLGQLMAARIVTGLGVGAFTATVPMWVTECTKAHNRGKLVMMQGWLAIGGVCLATWVDFGFYYVKNSSVNWRFPIAFQAVFALIVLSLILFLPESPRWLVMKEDYAAAEQVLARLYDMPEGSELMRSEVDMIRVSIGMEQVGSSKNPFAMTKNRHLQRTLTCIIVNILCQMTGVNIVTFYSNTIFQNILHYDGVQSRIISGCMQIWQVICAGTAILLIDRLGRRKLLVTCALGMAVGQAGLAALTKFASEGNTSAAGASLFFDFATLTFFPIGLFLLPLMYSAEIAPLLIRARVTSMASASNWLFNFLLAEVTPIGFDTIGWKYYLVYMSISAFAAVFFYLFCPETKNRALEDIDEFYLRSDTIWDPPKIAKTLPYDAGVAGALEEKIESAEHAEAAYA